MLIDNIFKPPTLIQIGNRFNKKIILINKSNIKTNQTLMCFNEYDKNVYNLVSKKLVNLKIRQNDCFYLKNITNKKQKNQRYYLKTYKYVFNLSYSELISHFIIIKKQ